MSNTVPRTVEVYWESYLGFPNDAKSCKLKTRSNQIKLDQTRSNWIEEERIRRNAFDIPFGIELVSIYKTFIPLRAKGVGEFIEIRQKKFHPPVY